MDEEDPPLFEWTCQDISACTTSDVDCGAPIHQESSHTSFVLSPTAFQMRPPNKMPLTWPYLATRGVAVARADPRGRLATLSVMLRVTSTKTIRQDAAFVVQELASANVVLGRRGPRRGLVGRVRGLTSCSFAKTSSRSEGDYSVLGNHRRELDDMHKKQNCVLAEQHSLGRVAVHRPERGRPP